MGGGLNLRAATRNCVPRHVDGAERVKPRTRWDYDTKEGRNGRAVQVDIRLPC